MAKAKMREEAKKRRIIEEKKKRKRLEYLQQLQNKMLAKVAVLLEDTRGFQVMGIKCKKITTIFSEDETRQWPSKKIKGKQPERYCRDTGVKMKGANLCKRYVCTG